MRLLLSFMRDERGATAVEYGLLISILAVTLGTALANYYDVMNNMFSGLANTYNGAAQ